MRLKSVTRIPQRGERMNERGNNHIKETLIKFLDSDMGIAELTFEPWEYSSSGSLYSSIRKALKAHPDYPIDSQFIQGRIYLRRTN